MSMKALTILSMCVVVGCFLVLFQIFSGRKNENEVSILAFANVIIGHSCMFDDNFLLCHLFAGGKWMGEK